MSKVSPEFARLIKRIMWEKGLTFRAAALKTNLSAAYWKDMSDGRVPSEEVISRISAAFPEVDANELRIAAGYAPSMSEMDAVKAVELALRGQRKLPEEGKRQIVEFVRRIQEHYARGSD